MKRNKVLALSDDRVRMVLLLQRNRTIDTYTKGIYSFSDDQI